MRAEAEPATPAAPAGVADRAGAVRNDPAAIELMLFEHDADRALEFLDAGVTSFLVDWEHFGKDTRQQGFDTEIRLGTRDELQAMCKVPGATVWCRINQFGSHTRNEIDAAIDAGADGVFLPMVTGPEEVECFLRILDGRCEPGILVETADALARVDELARFPLARVYFGLNDFAISRGGGSIFRAVLDGSVQRARTAFQNTRFGFGGLTAVEGGYPVPCRRLVEELARIRCDFTFLRRSFRRDLATRRLPDVLDGIRAAWHASLRRDAATVARDQLDLQRILRELA